MNTLILLEDDWQANIGKQYIMQFSGSYQIVAMTPHATCALDTLKLEPLLEVVKTKWVEKLFMLCKELIDTCIAESFGNECFWHFWVLEK